MRVPDHPGAAAFLAAMEKAQPRSAAYHGRKILSLRERWGTADLTAALEHALEYGALDTQPVRARNGGCLLGQFTLLRQSSARGLFSSFG